MNRATRASPTAPPLPAGAPTATHAECAGWGGPALCLPSMTGAGPAMCVPMCLLDESDCGGVPDVPCVDIGTGFGMGLCIPGCLEDQDCGLGSACVGFGPLSYGVCQQSFDCASAGQPISVGGGTIGTLEIADADGLLCRAGALATELYSKVSIVHVRGTIAPGSCVDHVSVNGGVVEVVDGTYENVELVRGETEIAVTYLCGETPLGTQTVTVTGPEGWRANGLRPELRSQIRIGDEFVPQCLGVYGDYFEMPIEDGVIDLALSGPAHQVEEFVWTADASGTLTATCTHGRQSATTTLAVSPGLPAYVETSVVGAVSPLEVVAGTDVPFRCAAVDVEGTPVPLGQPRLDVTPLDGVEFVDATTLRFTRTGAYEVGCRLMSAETGPAYVVDVVGDTASAALHLNTHDIPVFASRGTILTLIARWMDAYGNDLGDGSAEIVVSYDDAGTAIPVEPEPEDGEPGIEVELEENGEYIVDWVGGGGVRVRTTSAVPLCGCDGCVHSLGAPNFVQLPSWAGEVEIVSVHRMTGVDPVVVPVAPRSTASEWAGLGLEERAATYFMDEDASRLSFVAIGGGWNTTVARFQIVPDSGAPFELSVACSEQIGPLTSIAEAEADFSRSVFEEQLAGGDDAHNSDSLSDVVVHALSPGGESWAEAISKVADAFGTVEDVIGYELADASLTARRITAAPGFLVGSETCGVWAEYVSCGLINPPGSDGDCDHPHWLAAGYRAPSHLPFPRASDFVPGPSDGHSWVATDPRPAEILVVQLSRFQSAFNRVGPGGAWRFVLRDVTQAELSESRTFLEVFSDSGAPEGSLINRDGEACDAYEERRPFFGFRWGSDDFERAEYPRSIRSHLALLEKDRAAIESVMDDVASWRPFSEPLADVREMIRSGMPIGDGWRNRSDAFGREAPTAFVASETGLMGVSRGLEWADLPGSLDLHPGRVEPVRGPGEDVAMAFEYPSVNGPLRAPEVLRTEVLVKAPDAYPEAPFADAAGGLPPGLGATIQAIGGVSVEPSLSTLRLWIAGADVRVATSTGASTPVRLTLAIPIELDAVTRPMGGVAATLSTSGAPVARWITVCDPVATQALLASAGLVLPWTTVDGHEILDTTLLETALVPIVSQHAFSLARTAIEQLYLPEWLIPVGLSSDTQPEGTPYGFVTVTEVDATPPVRFTQHAIELGGKFTRLGTQCTSDEDCACDPETDGELCTSAEMVCLQSGWCWNE